MFKLQRSCWHNLYNDAMGGVAAHIDEGANLNFLAIWVENDPEQKLDHIQIASESHTIDRVSLLGLLLRHLLRNNHINLNDVTDIFQYVIENHAKDIDNEGAAEAKAESGEV